MESRYITKNELTALKSALPPSAFLPFEVSIQTGLRIGDVLKIKVSDIKGNTIHYKAQKTSKVGKCSVSRSLVKRLKESAKDSAWCFPSPINPARHLTRQAMWARIKTAGQRAGLDLSGLSPHSFRKCFAVELFKSDGAQAVMEALQHSNIAVTEIYSLSDFTSGENADLPILRKDLPLIISRVVAFLNAKK